MIVLLIESVGLQENFRLLLLYDKKGFDLNQNLEESLRRRKRIVERIVLAMN
jgi:hypothetical protein